MTRLSLSSLARVARAATALSAVALGLALASAGPASATNPNLLTNGGFESGSLSPGWTAYDTGLDPGCSSVLVSSSGFASGDEATMAPDEGDYDAVIEQSCPSSAILISDPVTVPTDGELSLDLAYANYYDEWAFDAEAPFAIGEYIPNQWIIVDVIHSSAAYTSLNSSDIVATLFDSRAGSPPLSQDWETLTASLAAYAGQSVQVRVMEVGDEFYQPVWVDGVSLTGESAPPAPATPTNLSVTQASDTLTATWSASANATSYTCTLLYGYGNPSSFTVTTTSPTCSFGGVGPYATDGVSVVANDNAISSGASVGFMTPASPPTTAPPPTHSTAVTICQKGSTDKFKRLRGAHRTCPKGYHRV